MEQLEWLGYNAMKIARKSLAWDVAVVSILTQSYVDGTATGVGMAAELAAERKLMKYSNLPTNLTCIFQLIAVKIGSV